mmetsp:Transcript_33556/g.81126  ORF Transcript_33556/g.81126 Transcript_33556/m.81126 type:complete len:319 (+) Transcript_33556:82-1038(+)
MTNDQGDVLTAFTNLQEALASRDKSLKEREEAFEKRVRLFEKENPQTGNERDVIHLNVGGSTHVAVFRRTLTHFEHSMLATKFSGRWDDSLERDEEGKFFIDEDPEPFMTLINYLRRLDKRKRFDIDTPAPSATHNFCWMLEYYDLMLSVYPHQWSLVWGNEACTTEPSTPDDAFIIETGHLMCAFKLDLDEKSSEKPCNAASLTVVFEKGSVGQIGWTRSLGSSVKVGTGGYQDLALDLEGKSWFESGAAVVPGLDISTREKGIAICCTFNKKTDTYALQVVGSDPIMYREYKNSARLIPHISLIGKACISDLSYSF